jgi:Bacteriophage probable baseplate hub protein
MPENPTTSRPVYTATPTIRVNEQANDKVTQLLLGMEMVEHEGGMSALELRFNNIASNTSGGADFAFEDDAVLKLGATIAIYSGEVSGPQEIFRGKITAIEGRYPKNSPPELHVLAEDLLQTARMARRSKTHNDTKIADLARTVANQLGLTPVISGFSDSIGTQVQLNESDLAFLRRLLARYDGDIQVVGRELHVSPRSDVQRNQVEVALNSQLQEVRVLADLAHQVTKTTYTGWDVSQGQKISVNSQGKHLAPGSGRKGSEVLPNAIAQRSEHLGHLAARNQSEAQALADTSFDRRARKFLVATGTTEGNPSLRVGTHLKLTGLGKRFSNTYYVIYTNHRYNTDEGYLTEFRAECAYLGNQ